MDGGVIRKILGHSSTERCSKEAPCPPKKKKKKKQAEKELASEVGKKKQKSEFLQKLEKEVFQDEKDCQTI